MKKRQYWHFKKESGIEDSDALVPYKSRPIRYESDPINYQTPRPNPKNEKREIEYYPALTKRPEWIEKLREIYPEIVGMSEEEINAYFGNTPVENLLKGKVAKSALWHFSKEKDIEQTADDPTSGRPAQPDHFPNVVRPGGGYPEGRGEKTDAFCNKCKDQLIDGSCLRCDWGPQNRSVPVENFPLDPFEDDKAGIRAASWKFGSIKSTIFEILQEDRQTNNGISIMTNQEIADEVAKRLNRSYSAAQAQNRINHFQLRTPEETAYQLKLKAEKYQEKNALATALEQNPEKRTLVNSWIEEDDENGFQKYPNNTIIGMIEQELGRKFDVKILNKYIMRIGAGNSPAIS
jgi:hypothetical protein